MPFSGNEYAVGISWINEDRCDLLRVAKTEMRPGFSGVGGFVDAIACCEIGALQSFAAARVDNVRIGRSNGEVRRRTPVG